MEIRKVQKVGYSTISVSLPAPWVKAHSVKQGDQIIFSEEKDGTLRLAPRELADKKSSAVEYVINSDLCDEPGMLERMIVGNYVHGRDTITIIASKRFLNSQLQEVRNVTRRLIGLGIIEETSNRITLQCSIDPSKFPIDTIMRRLQILASTMQNDSIKALVDADFELARQTAARDDEADMIYWLAVRLILAAQHDRTVADRIGITEPAHVVSNRLIAKYLEVIADNAQTIALNVLELEKKHDHIEKHITSQLLKISEITHSICKQAMDCLYMGDIKLANSAIDLRKIVEREDEKFIEELGKSNTPVIVARLRAIALALRNIAENGSEIAEVAINRALELPNKLCEHRIIFQESR